MTAATTWTRTYTSRDLQQRAFYYTHISADPVDVDTVYAPERRPRSSPPTAARRSRRAGIQSHSDHHDIWINPLNNKAMVVGNDGGANVSIDRHEPGRRRTTSRRRRSTA